MPSLNEIAKNLLSEGKVGVVIGFEQAGTDGRTRPAFAHTPEQAEKLVFNHHCLNNLAVYLTKQKRPRDMKVGVVLKGCDLKALNMLVQEQQLDRSDVYVIGVACNGVVKDFEQDWQKDNVATKCIYCQMRKPAYTDEMVGELEDLTLPEDKHGAWSASIEAMSSDERFTFWTNEFERCVKCYACRQVCPLCYCEQCIAEKSNPQWIETSASPRGNMSWNLIRAFHLAGRCIGCNECERACPAEIPLSLLNRKMGMAAREEFSYMPGVDPDAPTLVGTYNTADREEFIM